MAGQSIWDVIYNLAGQSIRDVNFNMAGQILDVIFIWLASPFGMLG